jgi:hypothetical protein
MKSFVKLLKLKNKAKKDLSSVQKKVETVPGVTKKIILEKKVQKKKKSLFLKVGHSAKRYSKQTVKNILLSHAFHIFFKIFVGLILFCSVSYGVYMHFHASISNGVVVSKSEIVDRVAKLTTLPSGQPDAIVRVEDAEELKKQNSFYENVKIGDYILMYPKVAVIYDLLNNRIVSVKKSE